MTVPEQVPVTEQVANGVTVKFFVQFQYANKNDLHIYVDGVEPSIGEVYFDDNAFNFYSPPVAGKVIRIQRITPKERDTDYDQSDNTFRPRVANADFDKIWYVLQEVFTDIGGLSQAIQDEVIARIQGDEDLLNQLSTEISARILGDEAVTNDLKDYVNQVVGAILNDPTFDGIDADKVNVSSGGTQQQINDRGGATWYAKSVGYNLNDRVILDNGDEVRSTVANNTADPNVDMTGWVNESNFRKRTYYIEDFGASKTKTAAENTLAIKSAFAALKDNDNLLQSSDLISVDQTLLNPTSPLSNIAIKLNLDFGGSGADSAYVVAIYDTKDSLFDISIDGKNKNAILLRCQRCTGSVIPSNTVLKNADGTLSLVAGVFTRDSDDMNIVCKIKNIQTSNGTQVVRGIMVSDKTIPKNTSYIAPQINSVTCPENATVFDADGIYAEHSNADHTGGLRVQNGVYINCSKRFIKINMPNPIITGNVGKNTSNIKMYAFASSYNKDAGVVSNNIFKAKSCGYGLEFGSATTDLNFTVKTNMLSSEVVSDKSYAYRVSGTLKSAEISLSSENSGFVGLFSQVDAAVGLGQVLNMIGGSFDNLNGPAQNAITLIGGYSVANFAKIYCKNAVASRFFISAQNVATNIINIDDCKYNYSFGDIVPLEVRPNNLTNGSASRYENGKLIMQRQFTPASGVYLVGDIVEYTIPTTHVGATYTGTEWKNYGFINNSASTTYDPPSIAAGQSVTTTVTLAGAEVGKLVVVAFSRYSADIEITATVSASNTIAVKFKNTGSSAIDLLSGTLTVKLI